MFTLWFLYYNMLYILSPSSWFLTEAGNQRNMCFSATYCSGVEQSLKSIHQPCFTNKIKESFTIYLTRPFYYSLTVRSLRRRRERQSGRKSFIFNVSRRLLCIHFAGGESVKVAGSHSFSMWAGGELRR